MKRIARTIAVMVLVLACAAAAEAAGPPNPLTIVTPSFDLGSRAHDLVLNDAGDLAYVGTDDGMTIVDISNPAAPVKRGSVKVGEVSGIAVQGLHVYLAGVASSAGLVVVDVALPNAPVVLAKRKIPGSARDVALKDHVAYVASFGGELYLFDISDPTDPRQFKVIGLPTWNTGGEAAALAKLNSYVTAGNAKVTGVSVVGDKLFPLDWNYGKLYYYDVADATNPIFKGVHHAKFAFRVAGRVEDDPVRDAAYVLGAYGNSSFIFSVPLSSLDPNTATRQDDCTDCGSFHMTATDYGGITVSPNGKYVVYIAGKQGVVQVLDVSGDPAVMTDAGSLRIPRHGIKTAESMGVQIGPGDHIFTAAGTLGLQVFHYARSLSD